ncbi:hypothetical protein D0Z06_19965 [Geodermatophilus marinus]|nr:hypothetical protein D0Z06_19965 [Geodermatophilus sp. LHW52908]
MLRYVDLDEQAPQVTTTAHFAISLDRRYAYFHQSLLTRERRESPVQTAELKLIQLDTRTSDARTWSIVPPQDDDALEGANFHSAFYYEEAGRRFVGLLKTGAVIEHLSPYRRTEEDRTLEPMKPSTIWSLEIDETAHTIQAQLLPGVREMNGLALSHLDCDARSGDGFVLYANFKEADVAEETQGVNCYGESPDNVLEHYAGMLIEPLNTGMVMRYERRGGKSSIGRLQRAYDFRRTSHGHTWLPINLDIDPSGEFVFASFSGFHPRLLPDFVATAYPDRVANMARMRYVPPLLMRLRADTLEPDYDDRRSYLSYAEPVAMAVVGDTARSFVCTFSPEIGLRIYRADDLQCVVAHAVSARLHTWGDTHFRPDPPHMVFAQL